jgi:small conductance mechanosensitive channel
MNEIVAVILPYLGRIVLALAIFLMGRKAVSLLLQLIERRMEKVEMDQSLQTFLIPLLRVTLQALLFLTIAATVGIEITTFAAIIGAASLALGLAFQGSLANLAGGVLILIFKPFKVGDFIQAAGFSGTVMEIQIFHTVLRTPDNQKVIIPNADLSNASAINYSAYDNRRANIQLTVSYDSDLKKVKEVLYGVIAKQPLILDDPKPMVVMGGFGEDGATISVRVWADKSDYWTMYFALLEDIKVAFEEEGVRIPYRQMTVHLEQSREN